MTPEDPHDIDVVTRRNLAYIWSGAIIMFIFWVLFQFGDKMEILTLLIGFVTGVGTTILAVYFGAPFGKKTAGSTVNVTGDTPIVNTTPTPPEGK